jgi:hypothetical protein
MVTLRFIASKDFILQHVLKSFSKYPPFLRIKKEMWEMNEYLYAILSQNLEPLVFKKGLSNGISVATSSLKGNLSAIYATDDFKKIFRETKKYTIGIEREWNRNYKTALAHLTDITKIDLSKIEKEITVYVSHPKLCRGRSYLEDDVIAWSHSDEWKNYATVCLWHEIMHHITADASVAPHLMHALIELSCDNELRIRLNGGGKYFKENNVPIGHAYLVSLERKLLPDWKGYLHDPKENIFQFEKRMSKKHRSEPLTRPQSKIIAWAEWH